MVFFDRFATNLCVGTFPLLYEVIKKSQRNNNNNNNIVSSNCIHNFAAEDTGGVWRRAAKGRVRGWRPFQGPGSATVLWEVECMKNQLHSWVSRGEMKKSNR